jgi:hypothetical protein
MLACHGARLVVKSNSFQRRRLGWFKVITFEWLCACGLTIKTTSEKQMATAKDKHYRIHAANAGWSVPE